MAGPQVSLLAPRGTRGGVRERARNRERFMRRQAFAISRLLSHSSARLRRAREQGNLRRNIPVPLLPPLLPSSCDAFAVETARRYSTGIRYALP